MNADVKRIWVKVLRSGNYKQGSHYLRRNDKYCCLGVLCDIRGGTWTHETGTDVMRHGTQGSIMPGEEYLGQIGLSMAQARTLAGMNDGNCSFAEIATHIENNL